MQPWPDQGQNGADGHNQWQPGFVYPSQNGQYDPNQEAWSQPANYPQVSHDAQGGAAADFQFDSSQQDAGAFLEEQHLTASQPAQTAFHGGHGSMPLNQHQQFLPPGQDMMDPSFSNIHPSLFAQQQQPQQGKMSIGSGNSGMSHMALAQAQTHPHTHPQAFGQHDYSFSPQGSQAFSPPPTQYSQPQLMPRPSPGRQQSHTPVQQQFENNDGHVGFSQSQPYARPTQQSPATQQQQRPFSAQGQALAAQGNGQAGPFQSGPHAHLVYNQYSEPQQQAHLQQAHFQQPRFASQQPVQYQQSGTGSVGQVPAAQQLQQQVIGQATSQPTPPPAASNAQPAPVNQSISEFDSGATPESPTKKRKRATKAVPDVPTSEPPPPTLADLSVESVAKKAEEIDALEAPAPTTEESKFLAESGKRAKNAQIKAPPAKAVPFLGYDATIKLSAPKSFDKLSPLVAVPPRGGKPVVAGLGYGLPCEIQGHFTNLYKPSFDKAGLDERKAEAKTLLDEYDRSMKALGKRQPKYTEYPNAFKEQLKADEASKNKAGKKAKKDLEHERNKPIRAPTRPTDPTAAAAWDIIGIVNLEKGLTRTSALIAGRVQQAGEFLINLRTEANRAKLALDQGTKDNVPEAELTTLRKEADQKKEALYKALDATVEHADDSVLDNLGGHQKLVLSLINILISCIKSTDFSGKLPKIVLELFTHLTMTEKIVETPNFDTVRKRFEDKGDDDVKDLTREINLKIKKFKRANEPESATGYKGTSAAARAKAGIKPAGDLSTKRSRDDDSDTRTVKKLAVEPGSSLLSKKLGQTKSQTSSGVKIVAPKAATSILPGKTRPVAKPVPKPEAPAAADSPSASADEKNKAEPKKPVGKLDPKTALAKKEAKPAAPKPAPATASTSSAMSSISSLLDSINAKKPDPVVAAASKEGKRSETPETAEQRAKRLHKEARRKLRVSWKPEGELVQMKIFEKDDEEDEGRDVNMTRDAADDRSEGMMLKRRADVGIDDDDDDLPYQPWVTPVATDFSVLPESIRKKSYVTRGGSVGFSTEEQKLIAERGQRELMAIYTDPTDIPATPKSPPPEANVPRGSTKLGYLPKEDSRFQEIQLRWTEEQQMGLDQALIAALKRFDARDSLSTRLDSILGRVTQKGPGGAAVKPSAASSTITSGEMSKAVNNNVPFVMGPTAELPVLGWLRWDRMKSWRDPDPVHVDAARVHQYTDADSQMSGTAIEAAAATLAGKPYPATSPPAWLTKDEERVREWWLGFNKESAAKQRKEEEERARAEAEANALMAAGQGSANTQDWSAYYAQQQQAYAPYMALLQQVNSGQQQQPATAAMAQSQQSQIPDSQLQSILAAINQPSQQQPARAQPSSTGGYEPSYQAFSQGAQASAYTGEREWERGESQHSKSEHKDARDGRKKKATLPPHKPVNKALIGTKACTFWQQGKCARGDKCTFRHD